MEVEDRLDATLGQGFAVVSCISKPGQLADLVAGLGVSRGRDNDRWVIGVLLAGGHPLVLEQGLGPPNYQSDLFDPQ